MSDPFIVVTNIGKYGYGVRCFNPNGLVFLEGTVKEKIEIGPLARNFLRMWDKCGGNSKYAERARFRQYEKVEQRKCLEC